MCSALFAGTARLHTGNTTNRTNAARPNAIHTKRPRKRASIAAPAGRWSGTNATGISRLNRATFQCEKALRSLLDEHDDEDQHGDLRQHRALPGFEEFVDDAEPERRIHGARELANAAQHDHHERVDDVALSEIRSDVADLRQRAPGETCNSRSEAEREHVDARSRTAERARPDPVLRRRAPTPT